MVLLVMVVVEDLAPHQMIETDSNVTIVVGPELLRTNVGIFMDTLETYLHISFGEMGLVVVKEVVGLEQNRLNAHSVASSSLEFTPTSPTSSTPSDDSLSQKEIKALSVCFSA